MKAKFIAITFGILSAVSLKAQVNPWIPLMVNPPSTVRPARPLPLPPVTGSSYRIGSDTFYRFSDGTRGSSYSIGTDTYFRFSDGTRGSSYRIGDATYFRFR